LEKERLRANAAEDENEKLQEEIEELVQDGSVLEDLERRLVDTTADRDKLREDLAKTKRALQECKTSKDHEQSQFTTKLREEVAKFVQTIRQNKESNARAQEQLRGELKEEQGRRESLEAEVRARQEEVHGLKQQLEEKQSIYNDQMDALQIQLKDNVHQMRLKEREHLEQSERLTRQTKEKEREKELLSAEMTKTRQRLEEDYGERLQDALARATSAEAQVQTLQKKLANEEQRNERARKRLRPTARDDEENDGDRRSLETENRMLKEQKVEYEKQKVTLETDIRECRQQNNHLQEALIRAQQQLTDKEIEIGRLSVRLEGRE
jgi:chromosome segregation ATPase